MGKSLMLVLKWKLWLHNLASSVYSASHLFFFFFFGLSSFDSPFFPVIQVISSSITLHSSFSSQNFSFFHEGKHNFFGLNLFLEIEIVKAGGLKQRQLCLVTHQSCISCNWYLYEWGNFLVSRSQSCFGSQHLIVFHFLTQRMTVSSSHLPELTFLPLVGCSSSSQASYPFQVLVCQSSVQTLNLY